MKLSSVLRNVGLAVVVFGVGMAGVLVGSMLRSKTERTDAYIAVDPAAMSLLKTGMTFPDVAIAGAGDLARTRDAIGPEGAVFLFLDLECPPCADMATKWRDVQRLGALPGLRVVGVTNHSPDAVAAFREEHALPFPIAEDVEHLFLAQWRVQRFPLEVVVGSDGRIRSLSYDSVHPVDPSALAEKLGS
ncbi:MAG: TlpA family protein disulfide reductase [bacterium]